MTHSDRDPIGPAALPCFVIAERISGRILDRRRHHNQTLVIERTDTDSRENNQLWGMEDSPVLSKSDIVSEYSDRTISRITVGIVFERT